MKVKKLIDLLKKENPDMRVVVDGYESGFDEIHEIAYTHIGKRKRGKDKNWYDGEFADVQWKDSSNTEVALYLPRGGKK